MIPNNFFHKNNACPPRNGTGNPPVPQVFLPNTLPLSYPGTHFGLVSPTSLIQNPFVPLIMPSVPQSTPVMMVNTENLTSMARGTSLSTASRFASASAPWTSIVCPSKRYFAQTKSDCISRNPVDALIQETPQCSTSQSTSVKKILTESDPDKPGSTTSRRTEDVCPSVGEVSDAELSLSESDGEKDRYSRKKWKSGKRLNKRRRTSTSNEDSDESPSERKVPPSWQSITAADFADEDLSDTDEEIDMEQLKVAASDKWSQTVAAGRFYFRTHDGQQSGTKELKKLHDTVRSQLIGIIMSARNAQPQLDPPVIPTFHDHCKCGHESDTESENEEKSDSDEGTNESSDSSAENSSVVNYDGMSEQKKHTAVAKQEVIRKRNHPAILHPDLCFNEPNQMNDGPECRCSWAAKQSGVRHNKYAGEESIEKCLDNSSNSRRLFHYFLEVTPNPKAMARRCSFIDYDGKTYEFEGFSVFFHRSLPDTFPQNPTSHWTNDYSMRFITENPPENFTVDDLELFHEYLYSGLMEMYDLKRFPFRVDDGCPFYHCLPRFVRALPDNGKELLPMSTVLTFLLTSFKPFATEEEAIRYKNNPAEFQTFACNTRGSLVINPSKRPATIRADLIDRADFIPNNSEPLYPLITHFGLRPSSHTYNANPEYSKASKEYLKMRKTLTMKVRMNPEERKKLAQKAAELRALRNDSQMKRDFVISVPSRCFYRTGLYPDIVQHAVLVILACAHVRFHWSLEIYEKQRVRYVFKVDCF
ncbi:hypothetical protein AB6A40_008928 [Gnathostoma spinigerum]|uniref:Ribonuclease 3 central domain-containing protein n=1 Tax=Gnathostoma spinigerum TaxID=75299 RepID=A0ABD6EY92_9BILA